jgi:chloramphenicol 3-O phosphotransferase
MIVPGPTDVPRVLVLNGGSSSGKTTLARRLQTVLEGCWLRFGVDTLVEALPPRLFAAGGLHMTPDGAVDVGPRFTEVEDQWMVGLAAMARAGAHLVIEDNFVSGPRAQERWRDALAGLPVGWIGVRCRAEVAAAREAARGDRTAGMAAAQAEHVHGGIHYDLEVRTDDAGDPAGTIRAHFFASGHNRR